MFRLFSAVIIGIVLIHAIENAVADKFITGKITHIGSSSIDENSQVEVSLQDVSLMDVASKLIASTTISNPKTFPISYQIKYNPSDIKPHQTYSVSAKITGPDNKLIFINDVHTQVDFTVSASPTINIAVIRVEGSSSTSVTKRNNKKICGAVKCPGKPKVCAYGYQKQDGCEICKCHDPCNPHGKSILCGPKQRCFVEKKPNGTFGTRCGTVSTRQGRQIDSKNCSLPKFVGSCKGEFARFYYDSATKTCESFIYGGCDGNENNFKTKAECETTCNA